MGLVFLSILIPYVFLLAHLVHLHCVIIERYGFRVIVMSVGFMLVAMSLVLGLTGSPLGSLVGLVLVVMNSFSFCLFGKTLISPSSLNYRLAG